MKTLECIHFTDRELAETAGGLLTALEELLPVRFARGSDCTGGPAGRISSGAGDDHAALSDDVPTLVLPPAHRTGTTPAPQHALIRFADDPLVPWPFRGRTIEARAEIDGQARIHQPLRGDTILAVDRADSPVWTVAARGRARIHRTSLLLPRVAQGDDVGIAAAGIRFIQTLPLFQFLREVTEGQRLLEPPLRAGFIIDDPNLHWPNYGFADYREISRDARDQHYHVAFATIPLDAWWVHRGTAEIFARHANELSLLVHGNNHARQELARVRSPSDCGALLQQALARVRHMEAKSGLRVCRVMVPPHGACSSQMLAQLPRHGFESACISSGSLRAHNRGQAWTRSLGLTANETVAGCPVLPRWAFSDTTDMTLLTAAYLGQPLVLRGHHQDLKNGLDVLRQFARNINALGDVRWGSLSKLSRLGFRHRIDGNRMHVQPLSTRIDLQVPDGVSELRIEAGGSVWRAVDTGAPPGFLDGPEWVMPLNGQRYGSFQRLSKETTTTPELRSNSTGAKLIVRRILSEARDRLRVS